MSTVCYCGNADCPVRTMDRDACLNSLRAALTESQAREARLREWAERAARVIRNPACGSCQNVSAEAAMLLDAIDTPNPLLDELRTLRAENIKLKAQAEADYAPLADALCWARKMGVELPEPSPAVREVFAQFMSLRAERDQLRARVAELEAER